MENNRFVFDLDRFKEINKKIFCLKLNWELGTGPKKDRSDYGLDMFIRCLSLNNLYLNGCKCNFGITNEEQLSQLFREFVYLHIYPAKPTKLPSYRATWLIIDEYGFDFWKELKYTELTPSQIAAVDKKIAEVFCGKPNIRFFMPLNRKGLPIQKVIRIRKSFKLFPSEDINTQTHWKEMDKFKGGINSDEALYIKLTDRKYFAERKMHYIYEEICPIIDLGEYDCFKCNYYTGKRIYKHYIVSDYGWVSEKFKWLIDFYSNELSEKIKSIELRIEHDKELAEEKRRREEEARLEKFRYNKRNSHRRDYYISFDEASHKYTVGGVNLQSVTNIVENSFPKFDAQLHAKTTAAKMGMTEKEVIAMWERKGIESRELGTTMHQKIESYYQGKDSREDDAFRLFKMFTDKVRLEPYRTEWAVYDTEYNIAGTIDFVDYQDGKYTIYDWKRSDKIIANGMPVKVSKYQEKGLYPLEHLENCAYYHYALQLSLYKFILEKNYDIKVSDLRLGIFHPSYDKPYVLRMPYLENEVKTLMELRSEVIL